MLRRGLAILCGLLLLAVAASPGLAKARLIAVFPLRSTPALAMQARDVSRAIVNKLSAIEGYDAQLLPEPKTGPLGSAAAAAGAEIYIVGQLVAADNGYKLTIGSFAAATDQSINSYSATITATDILPDQPDIRALITAAVAKPAPNAGPKVLALLPYEDPGSTDPVALAVSQALAGDVAAAGVAVTKLAPLDDLQAVANAAKICVSNGASGILIPQGRYQQTVKPGFFSMTVTTHVDFQLSDVGCDGVVRWSTTTSGDDTVTGMTPNVPGSINAAYNAAVQRAAAARATANISQTPASAATPAEGSAASPIISSYVLLPFNVLGMADQRSADMTHAFLGRLQAHKLNVKAGAPTDPLTAIARAQQLCATNGSQAIIVPAVVMEQSSTTGAGAIPHANLHLTLLSCSGTIMSDVVAQGKFGPPMLFYRDPDQAVVSATDDASEKAITQLLSSSQPSR